MNKKPPSKKRFLPLFRWFYHLDFMNATLPFSSLRAFGFCLIAIQSHGQSQSIDVSPDVISYSVQLEPDIQNKSIKGKETIHFLTAANTKEVVFSSGNLKVDFVRGDLVERFFQRDQKLFITLSEEVKSGIEVKINYHGNPKKGVIFNANPPTAYTVYFTDEWMICNMNPDDRATIETDLMIQDGLKAVATGQFQGKSDDANKVTVFSWNQKNTTPAYTYGFAIGNFKETSDKQGDVKLNYYSLNWSTDELNKVFIETGNILEFFEEKSGVKYIQDSYSQILIGDHYQEMSGFSVLRDSYASSVLKDSSEIHLTSHELAHQWWGNMITCKSFQHFWLNEAFATFMSSAFNEYKFGKEKYDSDISIYKDIYDDILKKGKDKPLVFPHWDNPSKDDRNIVYYKGAYVLHLLKQELGYDAFWKGIKLYSQKYFGKSVVTQDFQKAMEKSSNKNLDDFFKKWVY